MKIYIQGRKVHTCLLDRTLYKQHMYSFTSNRFRQAAQNTAAMREDEYKRARDVLKEAESNLAHYTSTNASNPKTSEYHQRLTALRRKREQSQDHVKQCKNELDRAQRSLGEHKKLECIFGLNVFNRNADGLFIYYCNRLIVMFEPTKQLKGPSARDYRGICGIINVPYLVLEPTHNKQQFADNHEQRQLISTLSDHMEQYSNVSSTVVPGI